MARIQIGIELNTDKDPEPDIRVTPLDVEVPDEVAAAARVIERYFDQVDAQPHDGEADIKLPSKIPIRILFVKTDMRVDGNVFIRVAD